MHNHALHFTARTVPKVKATVRHERNMNPQIKKALGLHRPKTSLVVIVAGLTIHFAFPRYLVATNSMEPTMPSGSYVVAFRWAYLLGEPRVGDIVLFDPVEGISSCPWIHRIVAASGEPLPSSKRDGRKDTDNVFDALIASDGYAIPSGYVYQSGDSSSSYHGLVKQELIRGKVLFHFKLPWK